MKAVILLCNRLVKNLFGPRLNLFRLRFESLIITGKPSNVGLAARMGNRIWRNLQCLILLSSTPMHLRRRWRGSFIKNTNWQFHYTARKRNGKTSG